MDIYQQKIINLATSEHDNIKESDVYYLAMSQLLLFETLKLAKEGIITMDNRYMIFKGENYNCESFIIENSPEIISLHDFFVTKLDLNLIDAYYDWFVKSHPDFANVKNDAEIAELTKNTLDQFLDDQHITSLAYALLILDNKKSALYVTNDALLQAAKSITKLSKETYLYDLLIENRRQIHFKLHKKEKFSFKQALHIFTKH